MATPADQVAHAHEPHHAPSGAPHPEQHAHEHHHGNPLKKFLFSHWTDQAARTTALLAVLAAVASSQYALQISRAILAQAEATDEWNHYSAKSIKKHLTNSHQEMLAAMMLVSPQLKDQVAPMAKEAANESARYDRETKEIKTKAEGIDDQKRRHQRKGDRFQYAFVLLQAGVVLCTIASSSKRKMLWAVAVALGLFGLAMLGDGYLLLF